MSVAGLLNLNKPAGPTSHDLVGWVRRGTMTKKVGHAGTLDPMATGVLVLCLGSATRLSEYVMDSPKVYRARVHFGVETDTYDAEGTVIAQTDTALERDAVEVALAQFCGTIQQVPPMYSAIKQGGRRLYELARAGQEVERAARTITITRLDLIAWEPPLALLDVHCSPGTYVRSLAHDLGHTLGVGAHLAALERRASGAFRVEDAVPWAQFSAAMDAGTWQDHLLPPDRALANYPAVHLTPDQREDIRQGRAIPAEPGTDELARAYDAPGAFCAVLARRGDRWQPHKVFLP